MADVNTLKDQGNKAFAAKEYDSAVDLFTKAIAIDPKNHVLYSNRSAAYAGKRSWDSALDDAEECIKVNPTWSKGYARKGAALHGAQRYDDAIAAYEDGLKVEDSPALKKGLSEVRAAKDLKDEPFSLGKMFSDPALLRKLAQNPKTQRHLADPAFVQQIQMFQKNPQLANNALNGDPRMIDVLGVAMGIDMSGMTRPEGSNEFPPGFGENDSPPASPPRAPPRAPEPAPAASAKVEEDVEMTNDEDDEETKAKKEAEAEKKTGAELYKKREFEDAARHFQKAWDLWPKDITFLTNLGAAYYEQGNYDQAIETCEKAVEEGRSLRADYKLVAKALGRIGSSYHKKDDLASAIKYYQKSLSEHRTPDVLNKLHELERFKIEQDKKAYIDPEKSAIAREEGNVLFKGGDFAGAVKSYTESIKRDPSDARGYNNRAAAYMKLVAFPEALKDAKEAIKVDPSFIKAYIRKSNIHFAMKDINQAIETIQLATEHDVEKKHTAEITQLELKCQQALFSQRDGETQEQTLERAMRDPEVAGIMNDPVMQSILQQAQSDPASLQDHMKNPAIRGKIQKLINAGIIRTR